jgi:hypothetical protein
LVIFRQTKGRGGKPFWDRLHLLLLELGKGEVISKSDRTAVVKQYAKLYIKFGPNDQTIEGDQLVKLMKENGKWLVYAVQDTGEPQQGDEENPATGF